MSIARHAPTRLKTLKFSFNVRSHESGGEMEQGEEKLTFGPTIVVRDRVGVPVGNEGTGI